MLRHNPPTYQTIDNFVYLFDLTGPIIWLWTEANAGVHKVLNAYHHPIHPVNRQMILSDSVSLPYFHNTIEIKRTQTDI